MKNIKKTTLLLLLLMTVISACSSTKMKNRHYQQWNEISDNTTETENNENSTVYIEPNNSLKTELLNESISIHAIAPTENDNLNKEDSTINQSSTSKKDSNFRKNKIINGDFSLSDLNFKKQLKSSLFPTPSPATSDLSLLWIVIIILIVLWALGLISGNFGGLIHLLLVIALILLILWLLKII